MSVSFRSGKARRSVLARARVRSIRRMTRGPEAQIGFGGDVNDNQSVVRYRNVSLPRLSARPSAPGAPSASASSELAAR
jgi:hypothetical protein